MLGKKSQFLIQNNNIEFIRTSVIILKEYLEQLSSTIKDKNNKNSKQHNQQHITTSYHKDSTL